MHRNNYDTAADYIRSFQNGEEKGFNFFFREYYAALCYFSFQFVKEKPIAEEIAGDALMKLWARHDKFNNSQSLKSFLYTITRNTSLNWLRQQKKNNRQLREMKYLFDESESNRFQKIVETETYREIFAAIDKLPPQCRKIFQMLFFEGKNHQQIAEELNLSVSTIHNQKARALMLIRKSIAFIFLFTLVLI